MSYVFGINAYHGDSSTCLVQDGKLITAAQEERFRRIKHWAGLPREFEDITGVPAVHNTSFNENEPIFFRPREAIRCFLHTKMDVLVIGKYFIK